jgi:flagellar hook protein FlgE
MPIPSLFIGAGAVTTQQNAISIVANNIANVNTTAFKASKAYFQEQAGNILKSASSPTQTLGGTNPNEVGAGVTLSSVSTAFTQGSLKSTGIATDLAISGTGFFVVSSSSVEGGGLISPEFTRDGHFTLDTEGSLVNAAGQKVFAATFYETSSQKIKSINGYSDITYFTDQAFGAAMKPNNGIAGNPAVPAPTNTPFVGGSAPVFDATKLSELSIRGNLIENTGINTAVPGNLTISRQADGKMKFSFNDGNAGGASIYTVAVDTDKQISDGVLTFDLTNSAGAQIQMRIRLEPGVSSLEDVFKSIDYNASTATTDTMVFSGAAATTQVGSDITVGADDLPFMSTANVRSIMDPVKIPSFLFTVDPTLEKEVKNFTIEADGTYTIIGPSSEKMKLGRLLMSNFTNADGLIDNGGGTFKESSNSGAAAISVLGGPFDKSAPSFAGSRIVSGAVESSNVNLANEFAELIALQRGLQASAKTVTTSNEILQTLINL